MRSKKVLWGEGIVDVDAFLKNLDGDDPIRPANVRRKNFRDSINRDGSRSLYSNVHRARRVPLPYPDDPDDSDGSDYFDD